MLVRLVQTSRGKGAIAKATLSIPPAWSRASDDTSRLGNYLGADGRTSPVGSGRGRSLSADLCSAGRLLLLDQAAKKSLRAGPTRPPENLANQ